MKKQNDTIPLSGSDVTVYMRRGQFYDQPDVRPKGFRRSGDEEDGKISVFWHYKIWWLDFDKMRINVGKKGY